MSPKISVVVPVYKVELYIKECIDSILNQTFPDFELILVNDGSPDKSNEICLCAAQKDDRIRVLTQTNQGVTRARANGVNAATGEFITFVDGDDTLLPHSLETLISHADEKTDIVLGNIINFERQFTHVGIIPLIQYRQMCVTMQGIHNGPVSKLFRRSLFNDYVFDIPRELRIGEDAIMNIRLAYQVQRHIYSTGEKVYHYRNNAESVTHTLLPSPELVMAMDKSRLSSIPKEDLPQYIKAGLYKSLISHWINALHHTPRLSQETKDYRNYLHRIKKLSGYRFGWYSYFIFHCPNQICLSIFTGFCNIIRSICKKGKETNY